MRARFHACLLASAVAWCAGGLPAAADDAADIQEVVFDSLRAGFQRGDLAAFMKCLADDFKMIEGREEKPGKSDHTLNRKQLEGMMRLVFADLPEGGFKLTLASPRVEVRGDKAELRVMTTVQWDEDGEESDRQSEVYLLRRTADGWRVYENRFWMVESIQNDKTIDYDAKGWKTLDAIVEAAEKEGDLGKLVEALGDARRVVEAHKAAKKLTARDGATADDWVLRGWCAADAGDLEDAIKAFREALKLEPDSPVPSVIRDDTKDAERGGQR